MSYKALADAVEMMNDGVDALSKRMDAMGENVTKGLNIPGLKPETQAAEQRRKERMEAKMKAQQEADIKRMMKSMGR